MTACIPTRHKPMIILVILNNQPRGGIQQSRQPVKGRHFTEGRYLIVGMIWFFWGRHLLGYLVDT